jgi:hypothetical protein
LLLLFLHPVIYSQQDTTQEPPVIVEESEFIMQKSPWGAVLRSAVVPGWGQLYNESYIKAPVIWGIGAALAAGWIFYNDLYWDYSRQYSASNFSFAQAKSSRDIYRDNRDLMTIYMVLGYFLNLVDAYVDAHLFDFTVEEDSYINHTRLGFKLNF